MLKSLIPVVSFFLLSCTDDGLVRICGQTCALNENGEIVLDEEAQKITCHTGTLYCELGKEDTCKGWRLPSTERCEDNGVDQDCSGSPDDISYLPFEDLNDCKDTQMGVCALSNKVCIDDTWVCVPQVLYGEEVCDGLDNDCDGLEDSNDPSLVLSGPEFGYDGPPETLLVGECRPYHRECINGHEVLTGQNLPTVEICGNDDDDDCDGLTDERDEESIAEAFLLLIDFSGSMALTIESVITSLCDWAANSTFVLSKFSIITVGDAYDIAPYSQVLTDFVSPIEACQVLTDYYVLHGTNGGMEYVLYSILEANNSLSDLYVPWPSDLTRRVIFFTDEPPYGYAFPEDIEKQQVIENCDTNNYSVSAFVDPLNLINWRILPDRCNGWTEVLSNDPDDMALALQYRFGSECSQ